MVCFQPGFPTFGGLPEQRRCVAPSRVLVPAGSVGIGGSRYRYLIRSDARQLAAAGGRTPLALFESKNVKASAAAPAIARFVPQKGGVC